MDTNQICEEIKSKVNIKDVVSYFYGEVNRQNKTLCPFHTEKTPSFSIDEKENIFKCFGCGAGGDSISFVAKLKEISNFDSAKLIDSAFHLGIIENNDTKPQKKQKTIKKPTKAEEKAPFVPNPSIKPYLQGCIKNIDKQTYLQSRRLTLETLRKFRIGYDIERNAITIPYSNALTYYQTRCINEKKFFKPTTQDAGSEPIYNERALALKTRTPIFVVESPICAMSVAQEGGNAIATCGTGCLNKLSEAVKNNKPKGTLILCFDNDEAGQKATAEISKELDKLKVKYITYNIAPDVKDPNEMLNFDKKKFQYLIQDAIYKAKSLTATKYDLKSAAELRLADLPEPFWVVQELLPEGLAMLTASSKVGKSWMAQQLCIEVARGGKFLEHDTTKAATVYLALEDSDRRIQSRMNIYLRGDSTPPLYKYNTVAPTLDTGLLDVMEMYVTEDPQIKLIVIDTLQRVRGMPLKNENAYATDYRELGALKQFADKHHICVLLLHHVRKMEDKNDAFNMINGTNGMMGVLDTSWLIYKKNRLDTDATLILTGRDVSQQEFVINKGEKNGRWDLVGSPEVQELQRKKDEYNKNPIVRVIKELLKQQPSGWQGTVTDFKVASTKILLDGTRLPSDTKVGIELNKLTYDLALDNIIHEFDEKRTNRGKMHRFYNKNKYTGKPITEPNLVQSQLDF